MHLLLSYRQVRAGGLPDSQRNGRDMMISTIALARVIATYWIAEKVTYKKSSRILECFR